MTISNLPKCPHHLNRQASFQLQLQRGYHAATELTALYNLGTEGAAACLEGEMAQLLGSP